MPGPNSTSSEETTGTTGQQPPEGSTEQAGSGSNTSTKKDWKKLYEEAVDKHVAEVAVLEERYKGLQRTLATEQAKLSASSESLTTLTSQKTEADKMLASLQAQIAESTSKSETERVELDTLKRKLYRSELIMNKYPELAIFEKNNLLPEDEDGKLDELFATFAGRIKEIAANSVKEHVKGSVPDAPAPKETISPAAKNLLAKAKEASLRGDTVAYNQAMNEYYKLAQPES